MNLGFLPTKDEAIESLKITARRTRDIAVSGLADNIWKNQKLVDGAAVIKETLAKGMEVSHGLRIGAEQGLWEGTVLPIERLLRGGNPELKPLFGDASETADFVPDNRAELIAQIATNPGKYVPGQLKSMGVPAPIAGAVGLAADIAAPGVGGELDTLEDAVKLGKKIKTGKAISSLGQDFEKLRDLFRGFKGMSKADITKEHPEIELKRPVAATDPLTGKPAVIPAGETLTPYEIKSDELGNMTALVDGETYVVTRGNFKNIKNQSTEVGTGEAVPFAPELKGLEETVKADVEQPAGSAGSGYTIAPRYNTPALTIRGGKNYKEIYIQAPGQDLDMVAGELYGGRKFDDLTAQQKNVVKQGAHMGGFRNSTAHDRTLDTITWIRMNFREYNGEKVAFIEEIQSDWWQAMQDAMAKGEKFEGHELLDQWLELGWKRALQEAEASGAKYIAWTSGAQQAARYDKTLHLNSLSWEQGADAKSVWMEKKNGKTVGFDMADDGTIVVAGGGIHKDWEGKNIRDVFGKNLSDAIMKDMKGEIAGEGLNVGGEAFKNIYDIRSKNILEKLLGTDVKMLDMGLPVGRAITPDEIYRYEDELGNWQDLTPDNLRVGMTVNATSVEAGAEVADQSLEVTELLGGRRFEAADEFGDLQRYELPEPPTPEVFGSQPSIEITPAIKAKIRGEAPVIKKKPRKKVIQ